MSNLKESDEQILIRPEDYKSFVEKRNIHGEMHAVRPISADAISDAAIDLGMTPYFYDHGTCHIVDHEYSDEIASMIYYESSIDGKEQLVIDWFETKDGFHDFEEDRYGTAVWKIARKLKVKIVSDFWVKYHNQQFPDSGVARMGFGSSCFHEWTDETKQMLETIWDTYYGDFEYEREFKTIEQIYKEKEK